MVELINSLISCIHGVRSENGNYSTLSHSILLVTGRLVQSETAVAVAELTGPFRNQAGER